MAVPTASMIPVTIEKYKEITIVMVDVTAQIRLSSRKIFRGL